MERHSLMDSARQSASAPAEAVVKAVPAPVATAPAPSEKPAASILEPVHKSHHALERAASVRAAGDEPHALLVEKLALEWAETARDIVRATGAEARASEAGKVLSELSTQLERARILLEETQARAGRARVALDGLEKTAPTARVPQKEKGRPRRGDAK